MTCKNCGANLKEDAKFCENCGTAVEITEETKEVEKTEPIENTNIIDPVMPKEPQKKSGSKKKNNVLLFSIIGVGLVIIGIILFLVAFNGEEKISGEAALKRLNNSLNNIQSKGKNSGTITATATMESKEMGKFSVSAVAKYQKLDDKTYNFMVKLNKSLYFDEMSAYLNISDKNLNLYIQSAIIDMLGATSSDTNKWLKTEMDLSELGIESIVSTLENNTNLNIDVTKVLDENNFKYIGKEKGLSHFKLTIDKNVFARLANIANNNVELSREELDEANEAFEQIGAIEMDVYLDKNDELKKISIDLSKYLDETGNMKIVLTEEFSDLNNTVITIPSEALNSNTDLETYMEENSSFNYDYDYDFDDDDYDYDFDIDDYDFSF